MDEHSFPVDLRIEPGRTILEDSWYDTEFGDYRFYATPDNLKSIEIQLISSYAILERVSLDTKRSFSTVASFGEYSFRKIETKKGFFSPTWVETTDSFGKRADIIDAGVRDIQKQCYLTDGPSRKSTLLSENNFQRQTKIQRTIEGYRVVHQGDYLKNALSFQVSERMALTIKNDGIADEIAEKTCSAVFSMLKSGVPSIVLIAPWGLVAGVDKYSDFVPHLGYTSIDFTSSFEKVFFFDDFHRDVFPNEDYYRAFASFLLGKLLLHNDYSRSYTINKLIYGDTHPDTFFHIYSNFDIKYEIHRRGEINWGSWKSKQKCPYFEICFSPQDNKQQVILSKW